MTLGQSATEQSVIGELKKIVVLTGGSKIGAVIGSCTARRDAVDFAVPWFEKRVCLFLVDDIWPVKNGRTSFLTDLRQLKRESPESRMAISTRSITIAQCAGSLVKFGARDPLGSVSENIFMAHATRGTLVRITACQNSEIRNSIRKILHICAGLPIALAVLRFCQSHMTILRQRATPMPGGWREEEATLAMRTQWRARV